MFSHSFKINSYVVNKFLALIILVAVAAFVSALAYSSMALAEGEPPADVAAPAEETQPPADQPAAGQPAVESADPPAEETPPATAEEAPAPAGEQGEPAEDSAASGAPPTEENPNNADGEAGSAQGSDGTGDTTIETGDANAAADANNFVNADVVGASSGSATTTDDGSPPADDSVSQTDETHAATTTADAAVDVNGGGGTATTTQDAVTDTGGDAETATSTPDIAAGEDGPTATTTDSVLPADQANVGGEATTTADTVPEIDNPPEGDGECVEPAEADTSSEGDATSGNENDSGGNTINICGENNADVANDVGADAGTGENDADNNGGDASVDTGDATATSDIVNIINSNFIGSNGFFQILNLFGAIFGDVSLNFGDQASCSILGCKISDITVRNVNNANVENNVSANASTGGNSADGNGGDASVDTGDAFASVNVLNIVNTNVIGADFMTLMLNAFGSWTGNIILPPASDFEYSACEDETGCDGGFGSLSVNDSNNADIENNVSADADAGNNEANENGGGSSIETGDAMADTNLLTVANTNILGSNAIFIMLNVHGKWQGQVLGLPEGVEIVDTGSGFIIDGFGLSDGFSGGGTNVSIENGNTASVTNNVSASASTGGNSANGNGGNAVINTGDAIAAANVANIVNTNVIGRNWLFAIVNIFGNWTGNLAFGMPDLWIGETAVPSGDLLESGATIKYTFTYRNNGNAPANNARIVDDIADYVSVIDPGTGVVDNGAISWDIGTLNPGDTGTVTYTVSVLSSYIPTGSTQLENVVNINSDGEDANEEDNTDSIKIGVTRLERGNVRGSYRAKADLQIEKTIEGEKRDIFPGDIIEFEVKVWNRGPVSAYNVTVEDVMHAFDDKVIKKQRWELGEVRPDEEVFIEYTVQLSEYAPAGTYYNNARVEGEQQWGTPVPLVVSSTVFDVKVYTVGQRVADENMEKSTTIVSDKEDDSSILKDTPDLPEIPSAPVIEAHPEPEPTINLADAVPADITAVYTRPIGPVEREQGSRLERALASVAALPILKPENVTLLFIYLITFVMLLLLLRRRDN